MTTSEAINEIAAAAAKAQLELKPAVKGAINPAFRSKYSDLAAIIEAAHVYAKHGIAIFQDVTSSEAGVSVSTRLAHSAGQWIEFGPLTVPLSKKDAHGVGSATTYAKRYGLQAAALIPSDDDDGNAAAQGAPPARVEVPTVPEGYDDWWMDMVSTADAGTQALREAFQKSRLPYRSFTANQRNEKWEALKAKAEKVDAKAKKPEPTHA